MPSFVRLIAVALLIVPMAARATVVPERAALLSAAWLGQVGDDPGAKLALSWRGDAPAWIEVFEDVDGDGELGKGDRVVSEQAIGAGIEIIAVGDVGEQPFGVRWRGDGSAATTLVDVGSKGLTCGWQPGFHRDDLDAGVRAMVVWDSGTGPNLYVAGDFAFAGPIEVNRIARWDGFSWSPLPGPSAVGLGGQVFALTVWNDGGGDALYAGGSFTSAGGAIVNGVAKWNGIEWSALSGPSGIGVDGAVFALKAWDDGSGEVLYAGGTFSSAGGVAANRIATWDGAGWSALAADVDGPGGSVWAFEVWDDGGGPALFVGGLFGTIGGTVVSNIAKWDGATWSALEGSFGIGTDGRVSTMLVWDGGGGEELYVGGQFPGAGGIAAPGIARWSGADWAALPSGASGILPISVHALVGWNQGGTDVLVVGGDLAVTLPGASQKHLAMWDGTSWSTFVPPNQVDFDGTVLALETLDLGGGNLLYAGGFIRSANGVAVGGVARWDGAMWSALGFPGGSGLDGPVFALRSWDDGLGEAVYATGNFLHATGLFVESIARWDGFTWTPLTGSSGTGVAGFGYALAVWDDGGGEALYVGGQFASAGGLAAPFLAKWDGAEWSSVVDGMGGGPSGPVYALRVWDDGSGPALFVAGNFATAGGTAVNNIAKWDGTTWSALTGTLGTGVGDPGATARALAVWNDGVEEALYVGGDFASAGAIIVNQVARWDGAEWSALSGPGGDGVAGGAPSVVEALATWNDGSGEVLYVGGNFASAGGVTAHNIARWNGTVWSALAGPGGSGVGIGPSADSVRAMMAWNDGSGERLYVGGNFGTAGGLSAWNLARWDGSAWSRVWDPSGLGPNQAVNALAVLDDGINPVQLSVGGMFTTTGVLASSRFVPFAGTCDAVDPQDPSTVESSSHTAGGWGSSTSIAMSWSGASDAMSGVHRYRVRFDALANTVPDDTTWVPNTSDPHGTSSPSLVEGQWYFHLSTCDVAGNCTETVHRGPYGIDTTAPGVPGAVSSSSHSTTAVSDTTIDVSWGAATDVLSGLAYYRYTFTNSATPPACVSFPSPSFTTSASSSALADGSWYAHVCAVDNAGNTGAITTGGPYAIDSTAPTGLLVSSSSHTASTWSSDTTIDLSLSGATDASGIAGYAIAFDQNATTDPGTTPTQAGSSYEGTATSDGNSWYAHARACDQVGNCSPVVHLGPFWIDATAPSAPTGVGSGSHSVGSLSNDATIDTSWDAATDATSGVAGYAWTFLGADSWSCDGVIDGTGVSTSSPELSSGEFWFHVCTVDEAGNQSAVTAIGPFELDLVAPAVVAVDTVADTGDGELVDGESTGASITQLLVSFDEALDSTAATEPSHWSLVSTGPDGVFDSTPCAKPDADDLDFAPTALTLLAGDDVVRLDVGGGFALPRGRYRLDACPGITDAAGNPVVLTELEFESWNLNLVANPNLDDDLAGWSAGGSNPGGLAWSASDAEAKPTSGSLAVTTSGSDGATTTASICVDLEPGQPIVFGGALEYLAGGGGSNAQVTLHLTGSTSAQCLTPTGAATSTVLATAPTAGWVPFAASKPGRFVSVEAEIEVISGTAMGQVIRADLLSLEGPIFVDGFESGTTSAWSAAAP